MNKFLFLLFLVITGTAVQAQKIDSIYINLYTDSLKKGQNNYINIDGKFSDGKWLPLSSKEIEFSCTAASFNGNELIIPMDFKPEKVTVKAVLKSNPAVWKEITIWIKKMADPPLPTREEILNSPKKNKGT